MQKTAIRLFKTLALKKSWEDVIIQWLTPMKLVHYHRYK